MEGYKKEQRQTSAGYLPCDSRLTFLLRLHRDVVAALQPVYGVIVLAIARIIQQRIEVECSG